MIIGDFNGYKIEDYTDDNYTRLKTIKQPYHPNMKIFKTIKTVEDALKCHLLWDLENGETLCVPCHKKTDSYGWKIWNSYLRKEQS